MYIHVYIYIYIKQDKHRKHVVYHNLTTLVEIYFSIFWGFQKSMGNPKNRNISKLNGKLPKINRISPRINGHCQKSIETWNIPKKNADQKNPQEFPWEIPKDRLPSSGLRGRGKCENSDALDPSAASAALSVASAASATRVDMGHGEIHGKIHGKSLVVGYVPIMVHIWLIYGSYMLIYG